MNYLLKSLFFTILLLSLYSASPLTIITYLAVSISNPFIASGSKIGNKPYYNCEIIPEATILRKNWKIFRDETLNSYKNYSTILGDLFFENLVKKNMNGKNYI